MLNQVPGLGTRGIVGNVNDTQLAGNTPTAIVGAAIEPNMLAVLATAIDVHVAVAIGAAFVRVFIAARHQRSPGQQRKVATYSFVQPPGVSAVPVPSSKSSMSMSRFVAQPFSPIISSAGKTKMQQSKS